MSDDNDEKSCYSCGSDTDNATIIYERNYCDDCIVACDSCGQIVSSDDSIGSYCSECGFYCENCEDSDNRGNSHNINGEYWCESCYENRAFYCESCSESYPSSYDSYYVQGTTYCQGCYEDNCYYCDECNDDFSDGYPCDCRQDSNDSSPSGCHCNNCTVHEYSCKPLPIFHGESKQDLYMGFELECQINNDYSGASHYASTNLAENSVAILKSDSSIGRNGFEIVTQPHTHAQYRDKSDKLWQIIDTLRRNYQARSWDTDTCGLHIHISRKGFSSPAHLHRFLAFIYKNAEVMMKFAGRKSNYARFNDVWRFDEYDRPYFSLAHKLDRHAPTERYSAVNTNNEHTIELRFFRGTMNPSGVLSALDLAQAGVEYTRNLRLSDVKMGALQWDWFCDYVESNNGIYPDLYNRMAKVQQVDINKPIKLEA